MPPVDAIETFTKDLLQTMDKHTRDLKRWIVLCFSLQTAICLCAAYYFVMSRMA